MIRPCSSGLVLFLLLSALVVPFASAQYFGQNKVRWESHDFKVLKTEHFDIHYYGRESESVVAFGQMAERWYTRLSKLLNHELPPNQPIIVYASHPAFRATTVLPGFIGETTGGVTEGLRRRVIMPFAGPLAETDHVLGHELVHAFQYDATTPRTPQGGSGMPGVAALPLWFVEGMAEYLSVGPVDAHTAMWLRDVISREDFPTVKNLHNPKYFPYRFGQAFWAYVGGRYGDEVIGTMLRAAGRGGDVEGAIQSVLGISAEELSQSWRQAFIEEYEPILQATATPESQARELISEKSDGGELNVSPSLSPDGKHLTFFSEKSLFSVDMFLADAETGEVLRKVTQSAIDPHLDSLQFVYSAGAWSADSRRFAFGSIRKGKPELSIYSLDQNEVVQRIRFENLGDIVSATWSPDGRSVAFVAMQGGVNDLFVVDLETEDLRRLTNDIYAETHPAWSPDGSKIAYSTDRFTSEVATLSFGEFRLAFLDPSTGQASEVEAFVDGKHLSPQWAPDGESLYFLSDQDGISNIYRLHLATGDVRQITNLRTGVSGISAHSPAFSAATKANRLAFSAFREGNYDIFVIDSETALAGRIPEPRWENRAAAVLPPRSRTGGQVITLLESPRTGLPSASFETANYQPSLSLDYVAPPSISVGMSSFGSLVGGGTALYFSDLLGHHNLMTAFQTSSVGHGEILNNLSAIAAYQNQKSRWDWGFIGGQVPFLTGGYGSRVGTVDGEPVIVEEAVTFWQINREASAIFAYPFSRAQRIEFSSGYRNIDFDAKVRTETFSALTGQHLTGETTDIATPDSINMGTSSAALVYDTSIFGGTSPVIGQRYRFELGGAAGGLNFYTTLADYRKYFQLARPLTLAGRVLHFGRYGGDAEDQRLQDLFIGYPSLVRGYTAGSFSAQECQTIAADSNQGCPVFDRLFGSKMGVANLELRLALLGPLGVIQSRSIPPVEIAAFYDAGLTWTSRNNPFFLGGSRSEVTSYGGSLRFNILGFAIGQLSYVRPNDRPLKDWHWEFSLIPGF